MYLYINILSVQCSHFRQQSQPHTQPHSKSILIQLAKTDKQDWLVNNKKDEFFIHLYRRFYILLYIYVYYFFIFFILYIHMEESHNFYKQVFMGTPKPSEIPVSVNFRSKFNVRAIIVVAAAHSVVIIGKKLTF